MQTTITGTLVALELEYAPVVFNAILVTLCAVARCPAAFLRPEAALLGISVVASFELLPRDPPCCHAKRRDYF